MERISSLACAVLLLAGDAWAQSRPSAPVSLAVTTTSHGFAIPIDFSGLSFERGTLNSGNAGASGYLFSRSNTQLITLFQNVGIKNLRIGGGSVDDEIPAGTGSDGYTSIDSLFQFAQAAGVKVLYSLRLLNPTAKPIANLATDAAAIAQHIWQNDQPFVSSFAIGNEPDFHSYHTYKNHLEDPLIFETISGVLGSAYPSYFADWQNFANTIFGSASGAKFSGPDTGAYNTGTYTPDPTTGVSWTQQFADDLKSSGILADATQHYYVGGSPGSTIAQQAIDNMLSAAWVDNTAIGTQSAGSGTATTTYTPYPWLYSNNLAPIVADGVPYRLTESNDYLTGVPGASNGFASALWAVDYMHWWAAHNGTGVNFHNKQWIYTDTIIPDPNPCNGTCGNYQTAPKGYGIKTFDLGGHGYVEPITISNPAGINVTAYAVGTAQDLYVTIVNKTHLSTNDITDANVTISPKGFVAASAAAMTLTDGEPGNASLAAAMLGGASITNNSRWLGKWTPLAPDTSGTVMLTVPSATAVVVKIQAASHYGGPIQINQNGALEMFATDSNGNVLHTWQKAANVPNSSLGNWNGWTNNLSGVFSKAGMAVVKNLNNTLEVFAPSTTDDVYYNYQLTPDGAWNGWVDMGSGSNGVTYLQAANNADGSLSVFGIGANGDAWYASENAPSVGWSAWYDLSGVNIEPGFVVGQDLNGRLELFGVDNSGNVWRNSQTDSGGWIGWTELSGEVLNPRLAVARNLDGRLEVIGLAANGDLWHIAQQTPGGNWNGWSELNTKTPGVPPGHEKLKSGFVAGQNADGRLVIFGVGRGTRDVWSVWQQTPGGSWGGWTDLGGANIDPQLVVSNAADGRIQLFGIGSNDDVWSAWQETPGGAWSGWADFGGSGLKFYLGQP